MNGHNSDVEAIRRRFPWAVDIVRDRFSAGLKHLTDPQFLKRRYHEFKYRRDPVYVDLLSGMNDEELARAFVSYWTIGQTLATQSRFWLENAIAQILVHRAQIQNRSDVQVYSMPMLADGWLQKEATISEMGEAIREEATSRRPWRVLVQRNALEVIDVLVGQQERDRVERNSQRSRAWLDDADAESINKDLTHLQKVIASLTGPPPDEITLQCNLLVVEPDRLDGNIHAWAFRFVNQRTIATHANRKQERANLLRLYAFLAQEKILRDPTQLHVSVAEIVPRRSEFDQLDRYPDYFSTKTYWTTDRFWDFMGVPYGVITLGIQDVAVEFSERLKTGLRQLLPAS